MKQLLFLFSIFLISCSDGVLNEVQGDEPATDNSAGAEIPEGSSNNLEPNNNTPTGNASNPTETEAALYLASNGLTVKAGTLASIGDRIEFNGNEYLVVDNSTLRDIVKNDREILTYLVTSFVTDMSYLFEGRQTLTPNIGGWDTSQVQNMSYLFNGANIYNGDISQWDTSQVNNMSYMFAGASLYNRDLGDWNTAQVTQMDGMFYEASIFNQNLSSWCVNLITEAPTDFSRLSALTNNFLPTWGSCPD